MSKKIVLLLVLFFGLIMKVNAIEKEFSLYDVFKEKAVADNIKSEYVESDNGIDFSHTSSNTNGKGIYVISDTMDDENPIYYYRGDINNNFIILENHCWEILRTTSDGKIKLLYAGVESNGKCLATNNELWALDTKVKYNLDNNEDSLGYMIPDDDGNINAKDSIVKAEVDNWFKNNFENKIDSFADTIFCNDRSYDHTASHYEGWKRLQDGTPSIECTRIEDSFSVSDIGNGKLTYPVALITSDELMYAGAQYLNIDAENYYNSWALVNAAYWAMTPNSSNKILYPNSLGYINRNSMTSTSGVRPVVAIDKDTVLLSGEGTRENPYSVPKQTKYQIEKDEYIDLDLETAIENQYIELKHLNKENYSFVGYKFYDSNNNEINLRIIKENNTNYIKMPNQNIRIETIWKEIEKPVIDNNTEEIIVEETSVNILNPETSDNIKLFFLLLIISFISTIILLIVIKKEE